jgi:hypothetical protein
VRRQGIAHAVAVIDIHLTAIGLDEELFGVCARLGHIGSLAEDAPRLKAGATMPGMSVFPLPTRGIQDDRYQQE